MDSELGRTEADMKVWTSNMLAVSRAGHDKGQLYVVLDEIPPESGMSDESGYLLLTDGKHRTLDHPKKKKRKHAELIIHLPEDLLADMQEITLDAHVRAILKSYEQRQGR